MLKHDFTVLMAILIFSMPCTVIAQISGPTTATQNNTYSYSYHSSTILGNPNWHPSGGTIMSQSQGGSPSSGYYYYANIKWVSTGTVSLMFANYSQPLSTIYVNVCSSGQAAGVSIPSSTSMCAGSTVQYTAVPTNGGTPTYEWKVNEVTKQSGSSATFSTNQLGLNDVVKVTMTSSITCLSPRTATASSTVTNVTQPATVSVTINNPNPVCVGSPNPDFNASVINGGTNPTYTWYRNGGVAQDNQISGNTSTYRPYYTLQNGDQVYCVVTSNASCIVAAQVSSNVVTISTQSITPSVSINVQNQTMCEGSPVTFTASSPQNITSYSWSIGSSYQLGSGSSFSPSGEFALHDPGETIHLTVGVSGSCLNSNSASTSLYETVYPPSSIGTLSVNSSEFCSSGTVNFSISSYVGGLSWKMRYHDGTGSWTSWASFSPASNTYPVTSGSGVTRVYEFQAFATSGTCAAAESGVRQVTVYPTSSLGTFDVNQTEFCTSALVNLTLSSFIGDLTWQYRSKDGVGGTFGNWTTFSTEETTSLTTPALISGEEIERIYEIQVQAKSGVCGATPWSVKSVTIDPPSGAGEISVAPGTAFYGSQTPSLTITNGPSIGTVVYESSTDGTSWSATPATLAVNQTTQFRAKATSAICSPAYSDPVTVYLYPLPVITGDGSNYLRDGGTTELSTGDYYSYQWSLDGMDIPDAIGPNYVAQQPGLYRVRVRGSASAPEATSEPFEVHEAGPSQDENYISTVTFLKEGIDPTALYKVRSEYYLQSTTYFDGLGRAKQSVITRGSPRGYDVIQPIVYDKFGREFRKYLPFVADGEIGWYVPNNSIIDFDAETETGTGDYIGVAQPFYDTPETKVAEDDGPFAETKFEASPLNRVIEQGAAGVDWQPGTGHTIKMSYETNATDEVLFWRYSPPGGAHPLGLVYPTSETAPNVPAHYDPNQLFKNVTKDEQDHEVIEYKDKEGRVVLKRVQAVDPPLTVGSDTQYASTYYIYDDFGQLVCVIPPEATKMLASQYYQEGSDDDTKELFLERWAFRYRYDERKRMVIKQVPGADSVVMVYDKRDRLVFTQDGVQRTADKWSFTRYDELNRPVMTGIYTHGSDLLRDDLRDLVEASPLYETYGGNAATHGYSSDMFSNTGFVQSGFDVLTVTYYDGYEFRTLMNDVNNDFEYKDNEIEADGGLKGQDTDEFDRVKGQVTGTKTRVLNSGTFLWTANYYDDHYRLIQSTSSNYKGGVTRLTNVYDFAGKVLRTKTHYTIPGHPTNADTEIYQRFSYDHAGRLLKTWHKITGGPEVVISSNEYNELGQLVTKKLHQTSLDGTPVSADPLADQEGTNYDNDLTSSSYSSSEDTYVASHSIRLLPGFTVPLNSTFTAKIGYSAEDAQAYNNAIEGEYLQTIDYRYNIRGWLTKINDPSDPLSEDLFNMGLAYNTPSSNGGEAQFNGNISEAVWKSVSLDKQSYGYDYDPMNRIAQGLYYNLAKPTENGYYDEKIGDPGNSDSQYRDAYDLNGNIRNLFRNGKTDVGTHALMDKLHYDYGGTDQSGGNKLMYVSDAQATAPLEEGFRELDDETDDYGYDDNGNLIKDGNKGIISIEYNHLNLPWKVSKSATEYIEYTYDATGRKLAQEVFGSEAKTTEYVGDLIFEDNVLQFILQPEGRVVKDTEAGAPDPWEYQYFLKDHLGNTRVVFSEKTHSTEYKATLEDDRQSEEMADFFRYPSSGSRSSLPVFDHTDAGTTYTYSQLLTGANGSSTDQNSRIGLSKSFEVKPGDVFDLEVYAKYEEPLATASDVDGLFGAIVDAFSLGAATSPLDGAPAYSAFEDVFAGGSGWINSSMWDETAPKAYLNYLLFDENFVLVDAGFDQVSTDCEQESDLNPVAPHDYLSLHVKVEQKGYLYVYLSNEQPTLTNVYFDDMKIVQYSAVEQVNDYYPFGLTFNSYQRENSVEQRWKFQGQEHIDDLELNWDSFEWRNYESDIGRFFNIDPLTESFYYNSPYAFAENMVIDHVELEGLEGIQVHEFTKNDQGQEQLSKIVYQLDVVVVTNSKGDKKGNNSSSLTDSDVSEIRSYLGSIFGGEHTDPESGVPVSFEFNLNQLDKSATTTKKNGKQKVVAGEFSTTSVLGELNSRAQDVDDGTRSFPAFVFGGEVPGTDGGATSTTIKFDPESREGARNAFGHELLHFMLDRYEGDAHALGGLLGRPIRSGIEVNKAILEKLRQNVPRSSQNDRRK